MSNTFLQTINGFDFSLIGFIGILVYMTWSTAVDSDKWESIARMWETKFSISEEQVFENEDKYERLCAKHAMLRVATDQAHEQLREAKAKYRIMEDYLEARCCCIRGFNIVCKYHEHLNSELERMRDPWNAPPQTPRKATQADIDAWNRLR